MENPAATASPMADPSGSLEGVSWNGSRVRSAVGTVARAAATLWLAGLTGRVAWTLIAEIRETAVLPQWDMAKHGLNGVRLAEALWHGDLWGFLRGVHELSVWPPVFPLLETPAFLVFGFGYDVPRYLVAGLFVVLVAAVFRAGRALDPDYGDAVGVVAASLVLTSPIYQVFATLVMLEIPGALWTALAVGAYWRAVGSHDPRRWRWVCITSLALFFCKFNYGLMWLVPLGLAEARRAAGSWRVLGDRILKAAGRIRWRRPWTAFLAFYGLALVILAIRGEVAVRIGGYELRGQSLGNPVYYLYLIVVARWLLRPRAHLRRFRAWLSGLELRYRQLVRWLVLPVALWMLLPSHTHDFLGFVENRSSGLALLSGESLLFYPSAFAEQFSAHPWAGWLLAGLALVPVVRLGRLDARGRILALALAFGAAALVAHPYKLPRFAFTLALLVWLAGSWVLVRGLVAICSWLGDRPARARHAGVGLVATAALVATTVTGVDQSRLRAERTWRTVPRSMRAVLDAVTDLAVAEPGTVLLGTWNLLSPSLVEWHLRQRHPRLAERGPIELRAALAAVPSAAWPEDSRHRRWLVVDLLPGAADGPSTAGFREETAWQAPYRDSLAASPSLDVEWDETFPEAGYVLRAYRRDPQSGLRRSRSVVPDVPSSLRSPPPAGG